MSVLKTYLYIVPDTIHPSEFRFKTPLRNKGEPKMRWFATAVACCLLILVTNNFPAQSQTVFKKALQKKYGYKSVSCYTCHKKGKDANGKSLGKEHRNEFGEALHVLLAEKDVTNRIKEAKKGGGESRKKVYAEVTKEFLEALDKVEEMKSEDGATWGKLLDEGKLKGVKVKKKTK